MIIFIQIKLHLGVYELGSVFKTFTIAAGLENKAINPNTIFKNLENSLTCDKYTISEHDKLPKNLKCWNKFWLDHQTLAAVKYSSKSRYRKLQRTF